MNLERLVAALGPAEVLGRAPVEVRDLAYDARAVEPGALFFCVPGGRADGHDFAADAVAGGAVALVVERPLDLDVPQIVVPSARAAMAPAADAFLASRRPSSRWPAHRHERQDDDGVSPLRDPGRGGPPARTARDDRGARRRRAARGRPDDARGDRPAAALPRDARCRRPLVCDRGVLARVRAAPARPRPLLGARLHEPEPGPPRLPRRPRVVLPGEAEALPRGRPARGGERRRRARSPARGGAARRAHVRVRRRRRGRPRRARRLGPEAARALQRRERARRARGRAAARDRRRRDPAWDRVDPRRAGTVRGGRRGAAVQRDRRLRAQARRARERPAGGARPRRREPRALRRRRRRRPRPRQAPADGEARLGACRRCDRHLRQPAQRGARRDHRGDRGRGGPARRDRARPRGRDRARAGAGAAGRRRPHRRQGRRAGSGARRPDDPVRRPRGRARGAACAGGAQ